MTASNASLVESRWWVGVATSTAAFGLLWVSWAILHAVSRIQPDSPASLVPASQGLSGPFLASILLTVGLVLLVATLVPVFAVSLLLDSRQVRSSGVDWSPSTVVYGGVSALHLLSLLIPVLQLLTLPAGAWYLYRRHRIVGLR